MLNDDRKFFLQGASLMQAFLISAGMPEPMLDDVMEAIREAKKRMRRRK